MGLLKTYVCALEECEQGEIINILNRKAETVGANAACDYIGRALDNIQSTKDRIDQTIKELQEIKKRCQSQEEIVKIETAKWLSENGVDRIEGDLVSSITVYDKAPRQKVIIEDASILDVSYMQLMPYETAIKSAINSGIEVKGARLETTHNEQSIKLNRKKVKADEDQLQF